MALYAFDGTWNSEKTTEDGQARNTNVVRFFNAYAQHSGTKDFYVAGVGTRFDLLGRAIGGVFGAGELIRLREAYDHVCEQWVAGDTIIDVVGFSRGAATTLDFCHMIQDRGIRKPRTDDVVEPEPRINFLGVWDIVGAFGLANTGWTGLNIGHHLVLPKRNLRYAFHALALDERRPSFLPTRLHGACEVWFRGVHSDVGGGNGNRGLNDIALKWMMSKAKAAGLPIRQSDLDALAPDPAALPHLDKKLKLNSRVVSAVDRRHYSVGPGPGYRIPPDTCPIESEADERQAREVGDVEILPEPSATRVTILMQTAEDAARQLDFTLDGARDAIETLIQGRIPLVNTDAELALARQNTANLVATMVRVAKQRDFHLLNEFFLTEALFKLEPLFPYSDQPVLTT